MPEIRLTTDAIDSRGFFDPRYTCDVDNSSPELKWELVSDETNPAEECAGFALVAEDPDARQGLFTHWVVYQIPPQIHHLPTGIPPQETLPNGIRQGVNSYGKLGYAGPCPPYRDHPHRYSFRIYALRSVPELPARVTREQLLQAILPHVLVTAEVTGKYQRIAQKAG